MTVDCIIKLKFKKIHKYLQKISIYIFASDTRKHSSRMRTIYLPTICATVANRCQHWWGKGWGSSSEQIWTGLKSWPPDITSRGSLCIEVPCQGGNMVRSNASWVTLSHGTPWGQNDCLTDRHKWKYYLSATSLAVGKYPQKTIHILHNCHVDCVT